MRSVNTRLWASVNERTVFVGYRWLAWALAGLLLIAGVASPWSEVRGIWLLLLTAVVNLGLTLGSARYLRFVRQYPAFLALDIGFGLALLWVSGGWRSPFQVYACSALVLPALLWGWRGGLISALAVSIGNLAILRFGSAALPRLLADQVNTGLTLIAPLPLALLLSPVFKRAQARAQSLGGRSVIANPAGIPEQRPLHEIHDNVLQHLSVATRQPGRSSEHAVADKPEAAPMGAVRAAAAPGSQDQRRMIFGTTIGCDMALDQALNQLVQGFGRYSSVTTRLAIVGEPLSLSPVVQNTLVRLAQEALLNVEQHARATSALVTLCCDQQQTVLSIQDNGVGLLDGTYQRPGVHALRAVGYRLAEVGGQLDVREGEDGGVTVCGSVPRLAMRNE